MRYLNGYPKVFCCCQKRCDSLIRMIRCLPKIRKWYSVVGSRSNSGSTWNGMIYGRSWRSE